MITATIAGPLTDPDATIEDRREALQKVTATIAEDGVDIGAVTLTRRGNTYYALGDWESPEVAKWRDGDRLTVGGIEAAVGVVVIERRRAGLAAVLTGEMLAAIASAETDPAAALVDVWRRVTKQPGASPQETR